MTTTKNPAPRWRAVNRANSKVEQHQEADAAAGWLARHLAVPEALARVLKRDLVRLKRILRF